MRNRRPTHRERINYLLRSIRFCVNARCENQCLGTARGLLLTLRARVCDVGLLRAAHTPADKSWPAAAARACSSPRRRARRASGARARGRLTRTRAVYQRPECRHVRSATRSARPVATSTRVTSDGESARRFEHRLSRERNTAPSTRGDCRSPTSAMCSQREKCALSHSCTSRRGGRAPGAPSIRSRARRARAQRAGGWPVHVSSSSARDNGASGHFRDEPLRHGCGKPLVDSTCPRARRSAPPFDDASRVGGLASSRRVDRLAAALLDS